MEAGTIFHSIQMLETRLVDLPSWSLCILDSTILVNQLPMERNPCYIRWGNISAISRQKQATFDEETFQLYHDKNKLHSMRKHFRYITTRTSYIRWGIYADIFTGTILVEIKYRYCTRLLQYSIFQLKMYLETKTLTIYMLTFLLEPHWRCNG
jgi:hypothetical protein